MPDAVEHGQPQPLSKGCYIWFGGWKLHPSEARACKMLNASARLSGLAKTAAIPPQAYFSQRMYHVITYRL